MHLQQHSHHPQTQAMQFANPSQLQTNIQPTMQTNMQPQMQTIIQPQMQAHPQMQAQLHTCLHPQMQTQQAHLQPQIQAHLQAHIQPQIQAHLQSQLQPQMMLCPVQYIPRMLVPSPAEEVVQQNQTYQSPATYIINVQNPPPWIQNRNAYLHQMQMNNMPYIHQNMVQNPMINYYQPMVMEHRLIPNVVDQNVQQTNQNMQHQNIHNTPNIVHSQPEMKQEPSALQSIPKTEVPSQTQAGRPPLNTMAQMITVNPLNVPQTNEVPQHIRTQLPDGLSVRTYIPPEIIENQSTIAPPTGHRLPKPIMRNSTTNTEPKAKRPREAGNTKEPTPKRSCVINQGVIDIVKNTQVKITVDSLPKIDVVAVNNTLRHHNTQQPSNVTRTSTPVDRTQIDEKLIRNTVFVQARGRVNETVQNEFSNNSSSQINDIRSTPDTQQSEINEPSTSQMSNRLLHPKPVKSVEEFQDSCASVYVPKTIKAKNGKGDKRTSSHSKKEIHKNNNIALNINGLLSGKINQPIAVESNLTKQDQETPAFKTTTPMFNSNASHLLRDHEKQVSLLSKVIDNTTAEAKSNSSKDTNVPNVNNHIKEESTKIVISKESSGTVKSEDINVVKKDASKLKIDSQILKNQTNANNKEEATVKIVKKDIKNPKSDKPIAEVAVKDAVRYVLTHVLDGHIIQESNLPFLVQKTVPPIIEPVIVEKRKRGRPRKHNIEIVSPPTMRETRLSFNIKNDKLFNNNRQLSVSLCKLEHSITKVTELKKHTRTNQKTAKLVVKTERLIKKPEESASEDTEADIADTSSVLVTKDDILKQIFNKGKTQRSVVQSEVSLEAKSTMGTKTSVEIKTTSGHTKTNVKNKIKTKPLINIEETIDNAESRVVETIKPVKEIKGTIAGAKKSATEEKKESTAEANVDEENNNTDCNDLQNEDPNPFENISKSAVKSWTVSDLTSHLTTHNWHESAQLLSEQEIDGESLLLANKEQLQQIGIEENQAQVISEFIEGSTNTDD